MELLRPLLSKFADNSMWKGSCVETLRQELQSNDTSPNNSGIGIVDRWGHPLTQDSPVPAGITWDTCRRFCDFDRIPTVFNFNIFAAGATNYLLPWLALTAQLPYETGRVNVIANFMSFCYAVGSPMLGTYSLMITILNQHWLRSKFEYLESSGRPLDATSKNVRIFLQESQQVPLRLSPEDGSLASLALFPENANWWAKLKTNILSTRRGVTLSLVAQILVAILSWILTVVAAFLSSLGNPSEALILSSGSLWIWLIPVICGWIAVGTQRGQGTIERALEENLASVVGTRNRNPSNPVANTDTIRRNTATSSNGSVDSLARPTTGNDENTRALPSSEGVPSLRTPRVDYGDTVDIAPAKQKAFQIANGKQLMRPLAKSPEVFQTLQPAEFSKNLVVSNCLGFSVAGDEKQEGPAFNYARVFTWWSMASELHHVFHTITKNREKESDLSLGSVPEVDRFEWIKLKGDRLSIARYCGLANREDKTPGSTITPRDIAEYPAWSSLDSALFQRIVLAILVAVYVQWGTTSAAVVISILTEVKGLGCRSGSYLLYGALATVSFALLFASSVFSHAAMVRHEAIARKPEDSVSEPSFALQGPSFALQFLPVASFVSSQAASVRYEAGARKGKGSVSEPTFFRVAAVVTRLLGRILVVLNTIWIILSSLWELVGFYNNCYCDSTYLSKGESGWIILFVEAQEMAAAARPPWAGGVFLSVFVTATSCAFFWLHCRGNLS